MPQPRRSAFTAARSIRCASYGYVPNSALAGGVTLRQAGAVRLNTSKSYDFLNRLTSVNSAGTVSPPGHISNLGTFNPPNGWRGNCKARRSYQFPMRIG